MIKFRVRRLDGTLTPDLDRKKAIEFVRSKMDVMTDGDRLTIIGVETHPLPDPPATATAPIKKIWRAAFKEFANLESWGVYNCRYISGTHDWSQHSWGNAVDFHYDNTANMLRLANWLAKQDLPIAKILYADREWLPNTGWFSAPNANHFDHVHIEGSPIFTGNPPCAP